MRGILAAVAVGLAILTAGCAGSAVQEVSAESHKETMQSWWNQQAAAPLDHVASAITWSGDTKNVALSDVRERCRDLARAADELAAKLPSPDQDLTAKVSGAVGDLREFAKGCSELNEHTEQADVDAMLKHRQAALDQLTAAHNLVI